MIHIVFQEADVETLRKSFLLDATLEGEVVLIRDDYAVGPLQEIWTKEGAEARRAWWMEVVQGTEPKDVGLDAWPDDQQTLEKLLESLQADPAQSLWIWAAQNNHDVCGYYWLMSQLKDYQGRVFILYLNNLPFISEKGTIFYPVNLFQIPAREFLKAKKLARPITPGEFEMDSEEWKRLCSEGKGVRILEGGKKLAQHDESFYDPELLGFIQQNWMKANRLISQFLQKAKQTTGDLFLLWRLRKMVQAGRIDFQGELKSPRDFEVKLRTVEAAELPFE